MELTSSATVAVAVAAYIGYQALTLRDVLTVSSEYGLPYVFERLPERLLASELIATFKGVTEIRTEGRAEDAVGC